MLFIVLIILTLIVIKVISRFTMGRCKSNVCLVGKTALVTGGNSGMGYQTALALAGRGCRVIIADKDNCDKSKENIINATGNSNIVIKNLDLSSLSSARELAKDINATEERLDILINNAGIMGFGNELSEDGLHIGMQVNHFGPFLLTHLLVDLLKKSAPSRIVFVSSAAAFLSNLTPNNLNYLKEKSSQLVLQINIYGNSKLCNILTADRFSEKLKDAGVTSNSLHPGIVYTQLPKKYCIPTGSNKIYHWITYLIVKFGLLKLFSKAPEEGAQTAIHLALSKKMENVTGKFFIDCVPFPKPPKAYNKDFANQIWKASEDYVKLTAEERL